jgi:hypothetical protein
MKNQEGRAQASTEAIKGRKKKRGKDIQQQVFAGGHPPNY